ncbi:MAG: hypothetical protein JW809_08880 [Pirellulales bacterium]|nr:hypothetical protein [Pirellulales bacterium]
MIHSPFTAIAWQILARYRWYVAGGAIYTFVAIALCQLLPTSACPGADEVRYCLLVPLVALPPMAFILFLLGADSDLAGADTGFPRRMLAIPLATWRLAMAPMLFGTAVTLAFCLAIGQGALRTIWPETAIWGPSLFVTAALAWGQAVAWMPFGLRWLRVIVCVVGIVIASWILSQTGGWPDAARMALIAAQIPIAFGAAVWGLRRARQGDGPDWSWLVARLQGAFASRARRRPFCSAARAQVWLEWQLHGTGMIWAIGLTAPLFAGAIVFVASAPPSAGIPPILNPVAPLFLPWFLALPMGATMGRFVAQGRASGMNSPFLAVRPVDCVGFVAAKLKVAALAVLVTYAAVVPLVAGLMAWTHDDRGLNLLVGLVSSPTQRVGIVLLALAILPAVAWRLVADGLFVSLTGRPWLTAVLGTAGVALFYAFLIVGFWIRSQPEWHEPLRAAAPWLLVAIAAIKLLLAGFLLRRLCRRLLDPALAARLVAVWLATVAALVAIAVWLLPRAVVSWPILLSAVILAVPAVRIALAPLALAWNRHR